MEDSNVNTVPPRAFTNPAVPTPVTNMGTLADYGAVSDHEPVCDIPPDFSWMTGLEVFRESFVFSVDSPLEKEIYRIVPFAKVAAGTNSPIQQLYADWHYVPFLTSKWWSGKVRLRFMAIKPPRVTGKLLIRWTPDLSDFSDSLGDGLRRRIKYEWDLGTSNEYTVEISGYNITRLRPTWLSRALLIFQNPTFPYQSCGQYFPIMQYSVGGLDIIPAQSLQPGSLFPDSIRVLVFQSWVDCDFHTSTDIRGSIPHFFSQGSVLPWTGTGD